MIKIATLVIRGVRLDYSIEEKLAKRLRYWSLRMTTTAGSGHPTSCLSAADLVSVLISKYLKYDLSDINNLQNDRIIFSKGHASALYYAAFQAIGAISQAELLEYRSYESNLEGHPTPRFKHAPVATGSLGVGLGFAAGMAYGMRKLNSEGTIWTLLGDGEMAEGSIWETCSFISQHNLNNIVAITDINRLGQSGPTAYGHRLEVYEKRFQSFGFQTILIDGHNFAQIDQAYTQAVDSKSPVIILAKTIKGKGVSFLEDQEGWHGKVLSTVEFERAEAELKPVITAGLIKPKKPKGQISSALPSSFDVKTAISYQIDDLFSVREAVGRALDKISEQNSEIIVLDGDVQNSTFTDLVQKHNANQFVECYIAEQLMVMVATGLGKVGYKPVLATFAAFLTRAFDQIRMANLSGADIMIIGTHVGVSIGQDGPSQMGLEDIAMMRSVNNSIVISPSDAVSADLLVRELMPCQGIRYLRAVRGKSPIIYSSEDKFKIGGSKEIYSSKDDKVCVIATGATVHEAISAYKILKKENIDIKVVDAYSIKPIDKESLIKIAADVNHFVVVEDHWFEGGLGDAVFNAFEGYDRIIPHITKLAVKEMPRSGKPEELLEHYGISAQHIVSAVKKIIDR